MATKLTNFLQSRTSLALPPKRKVFRVVASNFNEQALNGRIKDASCKANRTSRLSLSLFRKIANLPPEGRSLLPEEEYCDTSVRDCRMPIHVWESKCKSCGGSGTVNTIGSRGRRALGVCLTCSGVGYVRQISKCLEADENGFTIGRSKDPAAAPYCHRPQIPPHAAAPAAADVVSPPVSSEGGLAH